MKHIAVFRLSAMGDVAISVPVITAFAEQYPEVKITYLTRPLFTPMFSHIPNLEVFTPELTGKHAGLCGLYRLFKELVNKGIDGVADIHNVLRTNILKLYFKTTKIPFAQIDKGRIEKQALTRYKFKNFKQLKPSYQRYADVFAALGFPIDLSDDYLLPPPELSETVQELLNNELAIGVAPFASFQGKQYPFSKMCEVINTLNQRYPKATIYLFGGGKNEADQIRKVKLDRVVNMVGRLSFKQELELISHLDIMIAMDSGNAHLSAMYGVPTLTIWGVTHPYAGFYPYAQPLSNAILADRNLFPLIPTSVYGKTYPKGYEKAIETITVDTIVNKATSILSYEAIKNTNFM